MSPPLSEPIVVRRLLFFIVSPASSTGWHVLPVLPSCSCAHIGRKYDEEPSAQSRIPDIKSGSSQSPWFHSMLIWYLSLVPVLDDIFFKRIHPNLMALPHTYTCPLNLSYCFLHLWVNSLPSFFIFLTPQPAPSPRRPLSALSLTIMGYRFV